MIEKTYLSRMRTVDQCYKEIKALDPNTCISKKYLYKLARDNLVKHFKSGVKFYVDLDSLLKYFNMGAKEDVNSNFSLDNNIITYPPQNHIKKEYESIQARGETSPNSTKKENKYVM